MKGSNGKEGYFFKFEQKVFETHGKYNKYSLNRVQAYRVWAYFIWLYVLVFYGFLALLPSLAHCLWKFMKQLFSAVKHGHRGIEWCDFSRKGLLRREMAELIKVCKKRKGFSMASGESCNKFKHCFWFLMVVPLFFKCYILTEKVLCECQKGSTIEGSLIWKTVKREQNGKCLTLLQLPFHLPISRYLRCCYQSDQSRCARLMSGEIAGVQRDIQVTQNSGVFHLLLSFQKTFNPN